MSIVDQWPDVWSEYQKFFGYFDVHDEDQAAMITFTVAWSMTQPSLDQAADAMKEFVIRAQERGVPIGGLRIEMARIRLSLNPDVGGMTVAQRNFGVAAEDVGIAGCRVLADLLAPRERKV